MKKILVLALCALLAPGVSQGQVKAPEGLFTGLADIHATYAQNSRVSGVHSIGAGIALGLGLGHIVSPMLNTSVGFDYAKYANGLGSQYKESFDASVDIPVAEHLRPYVGGEVSANQGELKGLGLSYFGGFKFPVSSLSMYAEYRNEQIHEMYGHFNEGRLGAMVRF